MRSAIPCSLAILAALDAGSVPAQDAAGARRVGSPDVESLFERLTPTQRAAQLVMVWTLSRRDDAYPLRRQIAQWIVTPGIGGVIASLGNADDAAALIAELQQSAAVPLLLAGDFEASVAFRLRGATELGNNMLIGATGSSRLAHEAGVVTGREATALGFHWSFSPVLDVNVNPRNPIINVRSFGEDPALVGRLGAACVRGMQAEGLLATAKHFPGHGDTASDSHLVMATVPGDRARLERVELVPFRDAIAADVASIMTGHLSVPGLGESPTVPATLSRHILTDVLRGELGFRGLIVTDALDMGGVREAIRPEDAAVRALAAGADLLLMPPDPVAACNAVLAAVADGRLPAARFDDAVRSVLRTKQRCGLLDGRRTGPAADRVRVLAAPAHTALADRIAERGITLVADRDGLVPLRGGAEVTVLDLRDHDDGETRGEVMRSTLAAGARVVAFHALHPGSDGTAIESAVAAVERADTVVAALHVRVRSHSGRLALPAELAPIVAALRRSTRAVLVSFGNPYLIADFPDASTYLCAFVATPHTERAVGRALLGAAALTGRLPVGLPGRCGAGHGLTVVPRAGALPRVAPPDEDVAADLGDAIRERLERAVAERAFPGAVAMVARRGRVVAEVAIGRETWASDAAPITLASRFDLASLTKVCATTPAVLALADAGRLRLDQPVHELLPEFTGDGRESITIRHLLGHCAGLPPFRRYFESLDGRDAILAAVLREPLDYAPGQRTVYSDLGMILLAACVERAAGESFDGFVRRAVFAPLGVGARFAPRGTTLDAVPTERCAWRDRVLRGEVHDENAYAMGGVSGHAGLFGSAEDVLRVGLMFLSGGQGVLTGPRAREAIARLGLVPDSTRALGWDTFSAGGSGGTLLSATAFGHTGFTGTSIWCDPRRDLAIVLLSNRVHPTRDNDRHVAVRRELADLVASRIE